MKIFTGTVKHTKMAKTAAVDVTRTVAHSLYGKRVKRTKIYLVHDEIGVKEGDTVKFIASKPFSKMKKWKIVEVVGGKSKETKVKPIKSKKDLKTKK